MPTYTTLCLLLSLSVFAAPMQLPESPLFINTWLVAGPFGNDAANTGFEKDWIQEQAVEPHEGADAGGQAWRYFDDRLFSRNLDNYQDLRSYFVAKRHEKAAAQCAYTHVYVYAPTALSAELRVGADNEYKAWLNGNPVAESLENPGSFRELAATPIQLAQGWNRLLLKIANQAPGRFGFYARICSPDGANLEGLTYSTEGPQGSLRIATHAMDDAQTRDLPIAYREWAYFGADACQCEDDYLIMRDVLRKPEIALRASPFALTASGGKPPYTWELTSGALPDGLTLSPQGAITGTIGPDARLGEHAFTARVTDQQGATASKGLSIAVHERPSKWYEEARLVALIHRPESMQDADFTEFAHTMARQGYGLGMVISYNNGKHIYRWPSIYEPDNPMGDVVGKYKDALENAGIAFGMYIGNLNGSNHGGDNGALLLVEDAIRRYRPKAFWFDWAGWNAASVDAVYSLIKSYDPETLVVLNGIPTMSNGDWDVICLEGWGAWGERIWDLWPFDFGWTKKPVIESWRLVSCPAFEYTQDIQPDWQEYMRVTLALIGEGYVANLDHSPTVCSGLDDNGLLTSLDASPAFQAHVKMAEWANPPGLPPLYESYTRVNPGPLEPQPWGYNNINLAHDAIYLHMLTTHYGKTGMPESGSITVKPIAPGVVHATCMNTGQPVPFEQSGGQLTLDLSEIKADPVDTIIKIALDEPYPDFTPPARAAKAPIPPGNLATWKPARLMSNRGDYTLVPSSFHFAHYAVDGLADTFACGANEWDWTLHVDLRDAHPVRRIVVHLAKGYPTEYRVLLSKDGSAWRSVGEGRGESYGTLEHTFDPVDARYVRITCLKPNGPDQEGVQMHVAELEVYE